MKAKRKKNKPLPKPKRKQKVSAKHRVHHHNPIESDLPRDENELSFHLTPRQQETELGKYLVWWSDCGRYRIGRADSKSGYGSRFFAHEGKTVTIKTDLKTLDSAFAALRTYHCKKYNLETVITNEDDVIAKNEAKGYTQLPRETATTASPSSVETPQVQTTSSGTDRFGMRLGTRASRINAAITNEWKSCDQIKKEIKYRFPINSHMRKLHLQGHLEKKMADGVQLFRLKSNESKPVESSTIALDAKTRLKARLERMKQKDKQKKKKAKGKNPR